MRSSAGVVKRQVIIIWAHGGLCEDPFGTLSAEGADFATDTPPQSRMALISGPMPMMFMTLVRL